MAGEADRVGSVSGQARPLMIAVMRVDEGQSLPEWRSIRQAISSRAAQEGYTLVDTFDVIGDRGEDEPTYAAVETLAARGDTPPALLTVGVVDWDRIYGMARRLGSLVMVTEVHMSARV